METGISFALYDLTPPCVRVAATTAIQHSPQFTILHGPVTVTYVVLVHKLVQVPNPDDWTEYNQSLVGTIIHDISQVVKVNLEVKRHKLPRMTYLCEVRPA